MIVAAGCLSYSPGRSASSPPETSTTLQNNVTIHDLEFTPSTLPIDKGDYITWTNNDSVTHTVTSDTGAFDSGNIDLGSSFTHQFNETGTFPYHCTVFLFMKGTIIVQ